MNIRNFLSGMCERTLVQYKDENGSAEKTLKFLKDNDLHYIVYPLDNIAEIFHKERLAEEKRKVTPTYTVDTLDEAQSNMNLSGRKMKELRGRLDLLDNEEFYVYDYKNVMHQPYLIRQENEYSKHKYNNIQTTRLEGDYESKMDIVTFSGYVFKIRRERGVKSTTVLLNSMNEKGLIDMEEAVRVVNWKMSDFMDYALDTRDAYNLGLLKYLCLTRYKDKYGKGIEVEGYYYGFDLNYYDLVLLNRRTDFEDSTVFYKEGESYIQTQIALEQKVDDFRGEISHSFLNDLNGLPDDDFTDTTTMIESDFVELNYYGITMEVPVNQLHDTLIWLFKHKRVNKNMVSFDLLGEVQDTYRNVTVDGVRLKDEVYDKYEKLSEENQTELTTNQ